jgi:hypothetical protein
VQNDDSLIALPPFPLREDKIQHWLNLGAQWKI